MTNAECAITQEMLVAQREMFRLAKLRHGWTLVALSEATGMGITTLGQYARGETAMGGPAIKKLMRLDRDDFPAELISLLFAGTERHVADDPRSDLCHDTLAGKCIGYVGTHARARHPDSPGGVKIVPEEKRELDGQARGLAA